MSGTTDKVLGDHAPSRAHYQDFGRFRVVVNKQAGHVMIRDMDSSDAGQFYEVGKVEAAIGEFIGREF